MEWLGSNWIWLALGVGALAFFAFGRGGCGMSHGTHSHDRRNEEGDANVTTPPASQSALATEHAGHDSGQSQAGRQQHRHGC